MSEGTQQEIQKCPNFCATSDVTTGRGFILKFSSKNVSFASILHHIQRCQYGLGVTVVRITGEIPAKKDKWKQKMTEHLRNHPSSMNCPEASVSLCCADTLQKGGYVREWYIAVIDNALHNDELFDEFCFQQTQKKEPAHSIISDPGSPIYTLNDQSSQSRRALIQELVNLSESRMLFEIVGDTPFFNLFARDDGLQLDTYFLSHTFGPESRAVLSLSPTQGFWIVEFSRPWAGLGFPLTLPRTQDFATAEPTPCSIPVVGLSQEGEWRASRTGVYPPIEEVFASTIGISWAGLCSVRKQLRPKWVALCGKSREEVSNAVLKLLA